MKLYILIMYLIVTLSQCFLTFTQFKAVVNTRDNRYKGDLVARLLTTTLISIVFLQQLVDSETLGKILQNTETMLQSIDSLKSQLTEFESILCDNVQMLSEKLDLVLSNLGNTIVENKDQIITRIDDLNKSINQVKSEFNYIVNFLNNLNDIIVTLD